MGGSVFRSLGLQKAAGIALVLSLFAAVYLNFIVIMALAGTETGEFCPTCPDWTDLDGWLAKKDAYEKAEMDASIAKSKGTAVTESDSVSNAEKAIDASKSYAAADLIAFAPPGESGQVIVDVRAPSDYRSGHLPGARSLYWKDLQKSGGLDESKAEAALCKAGINQSDNLLIYGGTSGEEAAFVFWALNYLGQKHVSLLDGGTDAAVQAGVSLVKNAPNPTPTNYTEHIVPWLQVTADNLENLQSQGNVQILDARDFADFGRNSLTNAIPLTVDNLYENSRIKDAATLKELLDRRSLDATGIQIVYGTPQAYRLFYSLKLMGYNATLLEGDWWKDTKYSKSIVT
ncbi:Putative thiosulfate sulfurtransferase [uncultured archaeon]|nr:Putative thiosulfate sulfurtransferase [uncultured archaeon]